MKSGVYQITNEVNGKLYIGSAVNLERRKAQHIRYLKRGDHPNIHIRRSCKKHGVDSFSFKVIVNCAPENILSWEQIAIDGLNPELNICPKAGNTAGRKFSEETKQRIGRANLGKKHPPRSAEYRAKISAALKGKKKTPEHVNNMLANRKPIIYTDEVRQRYAEGTRKSYEDGTRTRQKSEQHKNKIGMFFADLSDDQVREIFKLKSNGMTGDDIARLYKKPASTICQILKRKRYKWVNIDG